MSATLAPPPRSRSPLAGCLIGCLSLIVGITALLGLVYFVIWYSPLPLRIIVNSLDTEDNTWSVKGINGSLVRGFEIEEIDFPGETSEDPSVHLKELTLKYEDVFGMFADEHVLIKEISVKQAEFVSSPDWFRDEETPPIEEDDETEETSPEPTPDQPSPSRPPSSEAAAPQFELQTLDLQNIQIRATDDSFEVRIPQIRVKDFNLETHSLSLQELVLQDFSVRSAELDPDLEIPAIRVVGLAIDEDTFDLSELVVNSNVLEVEFREAEPRQLGDHVIPYEGRIRGVVSAKIHPILLQSFDLETEFAPTADRLLVRSAGFNGAYEYVDRPNDSSQLTFTSFSPSQYFDLKSRLIPNRCTLTLTINTQTDNQIQTDDGECFLGPTRFEIPAQTIGNSYPDHLLEATAQVGEVQILTTVLDSDHPWLLDLAFSSTPDLPLPQILARIYFQSDYDQLRDEQRSEIDTLVTTLEQ